ncbi:putative sugar kinase [uncultured archaeon]|nr:putative sugar kinase [uncultured archaeon]
MRVKREKIICQGQLFEKSIRKVFNQKILYLSIKGDDMGFDIVTFGSAVIDTFVNTDIGEKNHLFSYPAGGKILINDLKFDIGGGGTNTAVAFSRLGLKTGCICNVGTDVDGKNILDLLKKENVIFLGKVDKSGITGHSVILDSHGGERTILTYKGVNNDISLSELNVKNIETKWLYYSALLGKSFETQKKLAELLHKQGTKIAFNPSSYIIKNLDFFPILKICDVLIVNLEEAEMICKRFNKKGDLFKSINELGPKIVLITNKDKFAVCFDGTRKYSIAPHKNIKVVERTGAGDAFASGFVAGQIAGLSIDKSLELALKESESVIKYFGAKNKLIKMKLK